MLKKILLPFFLFFSSHMVNLNSSAQQKNDTAVIATPKDTDTTGKNILAADTALVKKHNPKIATFRSAVLPGWGQAYNKKYWKIPIVYGALGTTAAVFFYNLKTYKDLKQAYIYISDTIPANDVL